MPRKSAVERDFEPLMPEGERPPPPDNLSEAQAEVWRRTVDSMKVGWIGGEAHELLRRYVVLMVEADRLENELSATPVTAPDYTRLRQSYLEVAKAALAYARSLRLTPRGNSPRDGRDPRRGSNGFKPWEDDCPAPRPVRPSLVRSKTHPRPWDD